MAYRQCGELFSLRGEEYIADDHQPLCPQLAQRRKDRVEFYFGADIQDVKLQAEREGGCLQAFRQGLGGWIGRVDEQSHDLGGGDNFA